MTSTRIKKSLLGVLVVIAGYVWWGNLKLFVVSGAPEAANLNRSGDRVAGAPIAFFLPPYRPPQVNPFLRPRGPSKLPPPSPRAQPVKPQLPPEYVLTGFLQRGGQSQAVIRMGEGSSTVLSIGDSLGAWKMVSVTDQAVIFQNGITRDTIRWHWPDKADR